MGIWLENISITDTDILYLNVAGQSIVVLDTFEAANELLERRSSLYSSRWAGISVFQERFLNIQCDSCRPRLPMLNELLGWDFNFAFMKYGTLWCPSDSKNRSYFSSSLRRKMVCFRTQMVAFLSITVSRRRQHRRIVHHVFHPEASLQFKPYSLKAARNLLNRFLDRPGDIMGNIKQ